MNGEKVSIITISFNSGSTIEKTIQSVLSQQYRPLEYVLVDGKSSDGTIELIEKYIPILLKAGIEVVFKSEPDHGISDAFNKGISRSSGSIIGIINSDDQLSENAVEVVANNFASDIDVLCGDCLWVDSYHDLMYIRKSKMKLEKLKYEMVLMHPACFVRKTAYLNGGGYNTEFKYVMDKELMARLYRKGAHFKYLPQTLAIMSAGGVSDANSRKVFQEGIEVAVQNGVPRWYAVVRSKYKVFALIIISKIKSSKLLWTLIHKD